MHSVLGVYAMLTHVPEYKQTKALLPEVEAADDEYWAALESAQTKEQVIAITEKYNTVLDKVIDALYEDTKDRNSKATIEQIYKAREGSSGTNFGINPPNVIRELIGCHDEDTHSEATAH